jgi:hypothetical protein
MKKNFFGDPILQPGDDIGAAFSETFDTDIDAPSPRGTSSMTTTMGWSATIRDEELNEIQVQDFESEEALRDYLRQARVDIA